jgi:hypothetical protein
LSRQGREGEGRRALPPPFLALCPCGRRWREGEEEGEWEGEDLWKGWALNITQDSLHKVQNKEYKIQKTPEAKFVYITLPMYL